MKYWKRGSAIRWENGRLLEVRECGIASEEGAVFSCRPDPVDGLPPVAPDRVCATAVEIEAMIPSPLRIERLVISEGISEHRAGSAIWSEHHERIHLSLVNGRERALIDLGSLDAEPVKDLAQVFARCESDVRPAPPRLRLAPNVSAAFLPSLVGLAPPNVELWQTGGGTDGRGRSIDEVRIDREPWPNWYRPSYRARPVRFPINLRIDCTVVEIEESRPRAVALLAPVSGLRARVLVQDGASAYPVIVQLTRIDAVSRERTWFPYGAGVLGSEIML